MDVDKEKKEKILEFAKECRLCVISTSVENIPESALVDFAITDDLEIIFNTYTASRKYRNLSINPNVSIVLGFGDMLKTLQYKGVATELDAGDEGRIMSVYKDNLEFFRRWKIKDMKYFSVRPTWVRLSDFSEYPPKEVEINI